MAKVVQLDLNLFESLQQILQSVILVAFNGNVMDHATSWTCIFFSKKKRQKAEMEI
jgi:hypothetical protein